MFMMQFIISLLAIATVAQAHYNFPALIYGGKTTTAWQYVRQWTDYYAYGPVQNVSSLDIRCNVNGYAASAPGTLNVTAGSTLGWVVSPNIYHPGPLLAYMAKVPTGKKVTTWDGSGSVWFKIFEQGPGGLGTSSLTWPTSNPVFVNTVNFTIPASTPPGDYLFRVEHIGLHVAQSINAAQFYLSCAQITVTGTGIGKPAPLVAFPGAYKATDPGILIAIYYPVPKNYTIPGPAIWKG